MNGTPRRETAGPVYGGSLALLTDLYQLTMAQGYWKSGLDRHEAVFHLYFRKNPFNGGYAVACGLDTAARFMESFAFAEDDLAYLASLPGAAVLPSPGAAGPSGGPEAPGSNGAPLFEPGFLDYLAGMRLECDVDAAPEGSVLFAPEPMLRVRGPLPQCQLLETALLNILNFQTLIATKASRVALAAAGSPVLEFGLRRAQGIDGGLSASRAAYVGGCAATSNALAGKLFGIPVRGTHAHSWVMAFDSELEAFEAYAEALPGDCVFLVDTYDTLGGVRRAIEVGRRLRERGRRLAGVRLDSGDLAALSIEARRLLDEAGFADAFVAASSDLDEKAIADLRGRGARVTVWGVGTKLVTGDGQPALGGVYKLGALRPPGGAWRDTLKASGEPAKASYPGILQVRRSSEGGRPVRDTIYDVRQPPAGGGAELLVPVFRAGRRVLPPADLAPGGQVVAGAGRAPFAGDGLEAARLRARGQLASLPAGVLRLSEPERFPVELEPGLAARREALLKTASVRGTRGESFNDIDSSAPSARTSRR
ncbi:MAG: nicotinate phosphoribosyltransferase [Elusimicrobia bacterium]|nr:nicotinate phosphoribosyltransferase [Elusimicrobiota bacterium]